jgi:hypothetical protein
VTTFKKKAAALGHSATSSILRILYSPECVEGEFSEVELPIYEVLGSSGCHKEKYERLGSLYHGTPAQER